MKKLNLVIAVFCTMFSLSVSAQVKKQVTMEEVNGEKTLTIRTNENGTEKVEVLKGEAADKKMAELNTASTANKMTEQVIVEEHNDQKVVKVIRNNNGVETIEEFKGEAAEKKLIEIEKANTAPSRSKPQKIESKGSIKRIEPVRN
jgi:glycogen debranching enzyme